MYLEIFLADFAVFRVFLGISWDFAEIPEFRGSEISGALSYRVFANCFDPPPYIHALPEFIPVF